jgi:TetR/AcrR family transcriptional regulator, transcriptional repressor for nem operon
MPRPTTFNSDEVVERAMRTFWTYGYAGTSIAELVEVTSLLRGSIYHTFGDKRSLYIKTLERYGHMALQQATTFWNEAEPRLSNWRTFLMVIVDLPEAEKRRGSMLCNCIVEVVPHDPEIARVVEGMLNEFKRILEDVLERGKQAGELHAHANTTALARYLLSSMQGLCVTAKAGAPREELLDIVEVTLSALH